MIPSGQVAMSGRDVYAVATDLMDAAWLSAAGTGYVDDDTLDTFWQKTALERAANASLVYLTNELAIRNPSLVSIDETLTWPADTERIAILPPEQVLRRRMLRVTEVCRMTTGGDPVPVDPCEYADRYRLSGDRWCVDGRYLYYLPKARATRSVRIHYAPAPDPIDFDSEDPITDLPVEFHPLLPIDTAIRAFPRERYTPADLIAQLSAGLEQMSRLARGRQSQSPARVRLGRQFGW